ncbi:hypothetical protein ACIRBY_15975 [Streptomyces sp. NPDC096136]|uniref:hypothetical protein n=1 Tax=Streptomyces sp. NPDC096136 TaxID=3366076 RepID=UPI003803F35A
MTLVKKGSRLITVDGTTYRWRLRGRPTYDQGLVVSPLAYAVERPRDGGGEARDETIDYQGAHTVLMIFAR